MGKVTSAVVLGSAILLVFTLSSRLVESGIVQELSEFYYDDTEGILPFQHQDDFHLTEDTEDDNKNALDEQNTQDQVSSVFLQRLTRQKSCEWTQCHLLPLSSSKQSSCPSGTYLESYKLCDPRGSRKISVQCCR